MDPQGHPYLTMRLGGRIRHPTSPQLAYFLLGGTPLAIGAPLYLLNRSNVLGTIISLGIGVPGGAVAFHHSGSALNENTSSKSIATVPGSMDCVPGNV